MSKTSLHRRVKEGSLKSHSNAIKPMLTEENRKPPNSPDMNVLDLGFFRALQSLQHQEAPRNVDELVAATHKAFNEISVESLSNVFLTLQLCMVEVMKKFGGNNYKLPHINKQKLAREGLLPTTISCDPELLIEAISSLQQESIE
ncbi:PREDICTED: uncharacterized protein LOC109191356 isoform X2 [Ipomoea nil]|uniref:uncharacterized protein LOC109190808 isoform X2 n=1 Tax=Ipomoea nil TaxID=35883 RepID=UPI0009009BA0|nr:PREDICTED: uncharacterized protein LOC109190808 isoform X2 [Ipomoea nil]XP_019197544.1 PREDICTED: uncharacterized protein LOC109191356 isoform X2 [Ipomoea nil]